MMKILHRTPKMKPQHLSLWLAEVSIIINSIERELLHLEGMYSMYVVHVILSFYKLGTYGLPGL